jgi:IS30 family transposase
MRIMTGHDMRQWDQAHLDHVAAELNGRPRETLEWMSASQALDEALQ